MVCQATEYHIQLWVFKRIEKAEACVVRLGIFLGGGYGFLFLHSGQQCSFASHF